MRPVPPIQRVHLSGIAGAAMAPLAGMFAESGYEVSGSDAGVYPPASALLESLGIKWFEGFREENLQPHPDLVVIANALPRGNPEIEYTLDQKIPYMSMAQAIEEFFLPGHESLVVSGTHGKTTTTSLLAWILHVAGRKPNFLIGGLAENFGKSYGLGGGEEFAIEGDEYDTAFFDKGPKFLHYHPDELIITSLEFDHADIYADLDAIELQFCRMVNLVPRRGRIIAWGDATPLAAPVLRVVQKAFCPVETYGLDGTTEWVAGDLTTTDDITEFRIVRRGAEMARVRLPLAGRHNVLNATAAAALALGRGVPRDAIEEALGTFRGVRRRLQIKGEASGILIVDDFAHHPTAIRATLEAARERWPGRRLWAAFEPRSNTMRRNVFEGPLADALAIADGVALGPVSRAKLLSDAERLSPERVAERIAAAGKYAAAYLSADAIADYLAAAVRSGDVVLVMSNGSFDGLCEKLLQRLGDKRVSEARSRS
jgi:UDP-N-acetylmuramate: L-alanyl-gamma-D-glutamyl-meso-diaminopimelate ligase